MWKNLKGIGMKKRKENIFYNKNVLGCGMEKTNNVNKQKNRKKVQIQIDTIKDMEIVKESDKIIKYYWQNIVLVVSLMVFILFLGNQFILKYKENVEKLFAGTTADESWMLEEKEEDTLKTSIQEEEMVTKSIERKRAYLTFDDGPSNNTNEILDILAENQVKATFFVIGKDEEYYDEYRRIVNEGHTLGMHTYSHNYSEIYASYDNFVNDVEELRKLLYDVTGVNCIYYRFPGGSSNTVSKVSMQVLADYIDEQGIVYFDWNALNEDAVTEGLSPEQLVENVMQDAVKYQDTIILMHDIDQCYTTVESLQMLIDRLEEEGYEILPIDENTPLIRHTIHT